MYERLLDQKNPPDEGFIKEYLGPSHAVLRQLEAFLESHYDLAKELKFPFGKHYGWGYKISHKTSHLCYVFFESGAFTVTLQLGDSSAAKVEGVLPLLSPKAKELWQNRYPCGTHGGWIHYRVQHPDDLRDLFEFIQAKRKPVRS